MTKLKPPVKALLEDSVKALVIQKLVRSRRLNRGSIIATEYPLRSLGVRADLAIRSRKFLGIEIKSALDSIRRLDRQINAYSAVFDDIILVVATKHLLKINIECMPAEIWELRSHGELKRIKISAKCQPRRKFLSYEDLMTKSELRRFVGEARAVANHKRAFLNAFDAKFAETSRMFWGSVEDLVAPEDVRLLSRHHIGRERLKERSRLRDVQWSAWFDELSANSSLSIDQSFQLSSVS